MNDREEVDILEGLKSELIKYISELYDNQRICSHKAFSQLTLEIIKILHMMLKFGFFSFQKEAKTERDFIFSPLMKKKNKKKVMNSNTQSDNELEKLFFIFSKILSFNSQMDQAISEKNKNNNIPLDSVEKTVHFVRLGFNELNKQVKAQVKALKNIFIFDKPEKVKSKKRKKVLIDSDINVDPLFMKMQTMRKILGKFENKTYSSNDESDSINTIEKMIKFEICQFFEYLFGVSEDFNLDNTLGYFHDVFTVRFKEKSLREILFSMQNESHFLWFLPDSLVEITSDNSFSNKTMKLFKNMQPMKSFDEIIGGPFIKVLLQAFYFAEDSELQNAIMKLIMRFSTKKFIFHGLLRKLELLFSSEQIETYHMLNKLVNKMHLYSIDCQNWLQYNDDSLALDRIETLIEKTKKQLGKIEGILKKNLKEKSLLEMKQKILKNTDGIQLIINLIETLFSYFENEHREKETKQRIFEINLGKKTSLAESFNDNIEKCKELLQIGFSILTIYCTENDENQMFLFQNLHKLFLIEYKENLGQISAFQAVIKGNIEICKSLTHSDLSFFVDLIISHGRNPEYLQIFETLIRLPDFSEISLQEMMEIKKLIREVLLDENKIKIINPFSQMEIESEESFFFDEEKLNEYKIKFVEIICEAFKGEITMNDILKAQKWFIAKDLMSLLSELSDQRKLNNYDSSLKLVQIILLFSNKSESYLNDLIDDYKIFPAILEFEVEYMKFTPESLYFLVEGFLSLVCLYARGVLNNANKFKFN